MELVNVVGSPFPVEFSSCSNRKPSDFLWTSSKETKYSVYIDNKIINGLDTPFSENKYGWLCESREIEPNIFRIVKENTQRFKSKFKNIFTCEEELLSKDSFFIYAPPGSNLPWTKEEEMMAYKKSKKCSMIASGKTRTPVHHRILQISKELIGKLDLFGGAHGSPKIGEGTGPKGDWWRSKLPALKDYMFSVVFENALYDKYYTEKITDCFATGTIPVYYGTRKVTEDFNKDGIIFYEDLSSIDDLNDSLYYSRMEAILDNLERVKNLKSADDQIYNNIIKRN